MLRLEYELEGDGERDTNLRREGRWDFARGAAEVK